MGEHPGCRFYAVPTGDGTLHCKHCDTTLPAPVVEVHRSRRCRTCRDPLISVDGAPFACEFESDHGWDAENAAELERDTRHLWATR
jgi:hypothetical protein